VHHVHRGGTGDRDDPRAGLIRHGSTTRKIGPAAHCGRLASIGPLTECASGEYGPTPWKHLLPFPEGPAKTMLYGTGYDHPHPAPSKKEHYGPGWPLVPARAVYSTVSQTDIG
jgi:hypothetical protein